MPDLLFSILTTGSVGLAGSLGAVGGAGAAGGAGGSSKVMTSVVRQLNGGMFCRIDATISSRIDSSTKRHQLMLTSQPA